MTEDDPNEAYEVVPIKSGPHGPPKGWCTETPFRSDTFPARKRPSDTRPILNVEQVLSPRRLGRRPRGTGDANEKPGPKARPIASIS
jgi:hypothetical protein